MQFIIFINRNFVCYYEGIEICPTLEGISMRSDHSKLGLEPVDARDLACFSSLPTSFSFLEYDGLVCRLGFNDYITFFGALGVWDIFSYIQFSPIDSKLGGFDKLRPYSVCIHMTSISVLVSDFFQRYKPQQTGYFLKLKLVFQPTDQSLDRFFFLLLLFFFTRDHFFLLLHFLLMSVLGRIAP